VQRSPWDPRLVAEQRVGVAPRREAYQFRSVWRVMVMASLASERARKLMSVEGRPRPSQRGRMHDGSISGKRPAGIATAAPPCTVATRRGSFSPCRSRRRWDKATFGRFRPAARVGQPPAWLCFARACSSASLTPCTCCAEKLRFFSPSRGHPLRGRHLRLSLHDLQHRDSVAFCRYNTLSRHDDVPHRHVARAAAKAARGLG